jgi:hypothetical protein
MDDIGTMFNRVQVQCKNISRQLETKHVAREVGISRMLQTTTILMIAREGVSSEARQFANRVMQHENISIMFLEGGTLEELDSRTDRLLTTLRGESRRIHNLKRLGREELVEEDEEQELVEREREAMEAHESVLSDLEDDQAASLTDFLDEDRD